MSLFDDDKQVKKTVHEIGADLATISVEELRARIDLLRAEIARLEAEIASKSSSRNVAEGLFKK
ncbi:DUF1192 domain-containing protein [Rhizobium sp. KVB221]|uniref:DUF1192 domain-containing protein n=1 Tax=Rhizobium setariae TaxID=2801340 RepID=A0A936YTI2_9HYPH|nr:DUF1192 domain-containing protein [Rhizobium setariae]MBL0374621.1 DUF1192 domain-containing protein [Rhizobium setariae]